MTRLRAIAALALCWASVAGIQTPADPRPCLSGQVLGDDDQGLAGAVVKLRREGTTTDISLSTDSTGRLAFSTCAAGWYTLTTTHPDHATQAYGATEPDGLGTPLILGGEPLIGLRIRLMRAGAVLGTVRKATGEPFGGVQVRISAPSIDAGGALTWNQLGASATTDAQGQYRVGALPPGRYLVRAVPPRVPISSTDPPEGFMPTYYPSASQIDAGTWIDVGSNRTLTAVDILLKTTRYVSASGRVVDATGALLPAMTVSMEDVTERASLSTVPVQGGRFSFQSVPVGEYFLRLSLTSADRPTRAIAFVDLNGASSAVESELTIRPGGTVNGKLALGEPNTTPVSAFRVTLVPRDPRIRSAALGVPVKSDGSFNIENVLPGDYRLGLTALGASALRLTSARVGDHESIDGFFTVGSGAVLQADLVASESKGAISGTLLNSAGAPALDYTVVVFPANKAQWPAWCRRSFGVRPANTGEFRVSNVPAGEYRVAVVPGARRNEWLLSEFLERIANGSTAVTVTESGTTGPLRLVVK